MKFLLIALLFVVTLFGSNVDKYANEMGFERDYKTAIVKAKKENKPLMMVLGADYCPWCRKFERKTLNSKLVKHYINSNVITLVVDKKYDAKTFPEKFQTQITPRVFFINPKDGESFYKTAGYIKRKDFLAELEKMQKLFSEK